MSSALGGGAGGAWGGGPFRPTRRPNGRGHLARRAASAAAASSSYFERVKVRACCIVLGLARDARAIATTLDARRWPKARAPNAAPPLLRPHTNGPADPPPPQQHNTTTNTQGWSGPLKAAVTSGSLCAVGDVLAQSIAGWYASREAAAATAAAGAKGAARGGRKAAPPSPAAAAAAYDARRTLRMAGFGLLFYGPYQYYWYSLLEHLMPRRTVPNFVAKVAANQALLAPVTLTVAFAWHLVFSSPSSSASSSASSSVAAPSPPPPPPASSKAGKKPRPSSGGGKGAAAPAQQPPACPLSALLAGTRLAPLPAKLRADFWPALVTGWKFWVPAASVNFCAVPLRQQVLYMSCCGVLWTAYLSHASGNQVSGGGGKAAAAGGKARR